MFYFTKISSPLDIMASSLYRELTERELDLITASALLETLLSHVPKA